ncbi:hypothetical protein JSR02_00805 [Candidatus Vidania fulgoroideae]|uniref:DNA-directed RNA polymerase insert domain-containing protein n=1 Tax=Candidatus Vidania fulgoroideorum TaxID=881286 RepID=A0A975ADR2_9PROT|nr:hypothetical protein JSR02_00805 [Candidatus Vidania fulgoroideae]
MPTKPILKIKPYNPAKIKIYIYNKNKITTDILNIIRRIIFTTAKSSLITTIAINNKTTEFSYISATEEDILSIIINIKDIRLLIKNCTQLQLKIRKKGRCFLKAKDLVVPNICTIFNTQKIIAKINPNKIVNIKIVIIKNHKVTNTFLKLNNSFTNPIKINSTTNPIKRIAIDTYKNQSFIKIHTNKTICPIYCYTQANKQLLRNIPLNTTTTYLKLPLIYKNKESLKNITHTKLKPQLKTLLKLNKIKTILEALRFNNKTAYIPLKINYKTQLIIELLKQGFHAIT